MIMSDGDLSNVRDGSQIYSGEESVGSPPAVANNPEAPSTAVGPIAVVAASAATGTAVTSLADASPGEAPSPNTSCYGQSREAALKSIGKDVR